MTGKQAAGEEGADPRLNPLQTFSFAFPGLAIAWLIPPMYAILGDFYLRYTAATAAGIGSAMVFSKIVDAITDPPVGLLSDRTSTRFGSRKPWIFAGMLIAIPMFWFFFNPPEDAGNTYFAIGIVLYYLVYTLVKIPYRSWLGEIAPSYAERSRVWSWFTIAALLGGVLIMVIPLVVSSPLLGWYDSAEFDRDMVSLIGLVGMIGLPLTLLMAFLFVPQGRRNAGETPSAKEYFRIFSDCRPFRAFLYGYSLSALGFGIFYSIVIVALTSYYGFAKQVPLFMLIMIAAQVASIPVWEYLARSTPKHRVWAYAWAAHSLFGLLFWFFPPQTELFWLFVACGAVTSILQGPHMLFPVSIVSDIVDYDTLKNRTSRSGNLFSLFTFTDKVLHAIGFGIGYYCMALFGYDAKLEANTAMAVFGLKLGFILLPALLFFLSALILVRFPIDARRHDVIRRRIEQRQLREATVL